MKSILLVFLALGLSSCAQMQVSKTYVASGATAPKYIYIRPFLVREHGMSGEQGGMGGGNRPIRQSIAPVEFANILQEEMSKMAPTTVLAYDEEAPAGWLVEGELDLVFGGSNVGRLLPIPIGPLGMSVLKVHVKVSDVQSGQVLYAFDLSGGSDFTGAFGNTGAPGVGTARSFDMRNAAARIRHELTPDRKRLGYREN